MQRLARMHGLALRVPLAAPDPMCLQGSELATHLGVEWHPRPPHIRLGGGDFERADGQGAAPQGASMRAAGCMRARGLGSMQCMPEVLAIP